MERVIHSLLFTRFDILREDLSAQSVLKGGRLGAGNNFKTFEKQAAKAVIRIKLVTAHPNMTHCVSIEFQHCILSCRLESTLQYHNFMLHVVNLEWQHLCCHENFQ